MDMVIPKVNVAPVRFSWLTYCSHTDVEMLTTIARPFDGLQTAINDYELRCD